jgi:hypothetical protein
MSVKIDDVEYKVSICEDHEDDASPKKVRSLVQEKAVEIEKIKQMAAKYGLTVGESEQTKPPSKTTAQPSGHKTFHQGLKPQKIAEPKEEIAESIPDAPAEINPSSVEGAPDVRLEKHASYKLPSAEKTPVITAKKDQKYVTESGREVVVPTMIYDDEGGKTSIRIVNTGGDRALQNRFKGMAEGSKGGAGPDFRNQYAVRDCTACGGTGVSRVDKSKPCPKCGGDGFFKG